MRIYTVHWLISADHLELGTGFRIGSSPTPGIGRSKQFTSRDKAEAHMDKLRDAATMLGLTTEYSVGMEDKEIE
jgi:hypothetical protein